MSASAPLLELNQVSRVFARRPALAERLVRAVTRGQPPGVVRAVDAVSMTLAPGEVLGLVGESGCGKSTTGRCILRLIEPSSGEVTFKGADVRQMSGETLRALRRDMQIIFQDPGGSLNPRMRVGNIVGEPLEVHGMASGDELRERVEALLERCGLWRAAADRYPHEFSGGQRQIGRAHV